MREGGTGVRPVFFCGKCGREPDGIFGKLTGWIVIHKILTAALLVSFAAMLFICDGVFGDRYKSVIKKYMKAIQTQDAA